MKIAITGGSKKSIEVSDRTFGASFNEPLIHQVVTAHRAKKRAGSKAQKSRSDARGGGAKPWRQKGTGRARSGTIRSPIWVGGGRAFAARPRDYAQKVNRKMYQAAMRSMLSELVREELQALGTKLGLKGTILLAKVGINGTVVGDADALLKLKQVLTQQFGEVFDKKTKLYVIVSDRQGTRLYASRKALQAEAGGEQQLNIKLSRSTTPRR